MGGGGGGKVIGRRAGEAKVRCMVSGNAVLVPHRAQADDEMGGLRRRCLWRSDVRECESYNILVPDCQGHQSSMPHLVSCQGSNAKIHNLSRQQHHENHRHDSQCFRRCTPARPNPSSVRCDCLSLLSTPFPQSANPRPTAQGPSARPQANFILRHRPAGHDFDLSQAIPAIRASAAVCDVVDRRVLALCSETFAFCTSICGRPTLCVQDYSPITESSRGRLIMSLENKQPPTNTSSHGTATTRRG